MTQMRAKMQVQSVDTANEGQEIVVFSAVSKSDGYPDDGLDENNTYAKFSLAASLKITIVNPALLGKHVVGEEYYVDFTKAE